MLKIVREGKGRDIKWKALRGDKLFLIGSLNDEQQLIFRDEDGNLFSDDVTTEENVGVVGSDSGSTIAVEKELAGKVGELSVEASGGSSEESKPSLNKGGDLLDGSVITEKDTGSKLKNILAGISAHVPDYEPLPVADVSAIATAKEVIKDIRDGSITPTTFDSRELFCGQLAEIQDEINKQNNLIVTLKEKKEKFQYSFNELIQKFQNLMSEGEVKKLTNNLATLKASFEDKVTLLEEYNDQLSRYKKVIKSNPEGELFYYEQYFGGEDLLLIKHFGINTVMTAEQAKSLIGVEKLNLEENSKDPTPSQTEKNETDASSTRTGASKPKNKTKLKQKATNDGSVKSQADTENNEDNAKKVATESNIPMHPLEILLIRKAIDALHGSTKAVAVDIFERINGIIQQDTQQRCKTHAIVLYMQKVGDKNQIIVIDPTNSGHSVHIASEVNIVRIFGDSVKCAPQFKIPSLLKIYNPPEDKEVGPESTKYRDCIDISVKLIRALNLLARSIEFDKLAELIVVQEITNKDFTKLLTGKDEAKAKDDGIDINARIRQATDDKVRHKINSLMIKIGDQIKYAKKYYDDIVVQSMEKERLDFFCKAYAPEDYEQGIADLLAIYKKNEKTFVAEVDLAGDIP